MGHTFQDSLFWLGTGNLVARPSRFCQDACLVALITPAITSSHQRVLRQRDTCTVDALARLREILAYTSFMAANSFILQKKPSSSPHDYIRAAASIPSRFRALVPSVANVAPVNSPTLGQRHLPRRTEIIVRMAVNTVRWFGPRSVRITSLMCCLLFRLGRRRGWFL